VASALHVFGPYQLDATTRRLLRDGEPVALSSRQFDILLLLVTHAGQLLSKDALIEAAWPGVAVTDNSLEQAISALRRTLGTDHGEGYIETAARRGYRFAARVTRIDRRETVETLEALLAPHKAWIEGRAALETLERDHILHAREVFERVLGEVADQASAHVGLANACIMQFEMTRADLNPDTASLALAAAHARDACRLDPRYGEAWATLGFVLDRTGHRADALAASRKAVSLEPDNWRHHLRLAYVSWGEERLREARRTLALLPGFPLAHWLAATVHVAREALDEAERELAAGIEAQGTSHSRFSSVALHWLDGLVRLTRGDEPGALHAFEEELARERSGHLYARECCANTWYAVAAVRLRHEDASGAVAALRETLARVPLHPSARVTLAHLVPSDRAQPSDPQASAIVCALQGRPDRAAAAVEEALASAPEGSAFWTLPVDPILRVHGDERWSRALSRLRNRAA
jgi:DNA-binding winged helix-turn-helix (wHTH) protein